jgi:UPF0271 protein
MNAPALAIDLNADLGEGFPHDEALLRRVTSASVCCGAHAGDPATIGRTLAAAREHAVVVGAHPGFDDRAHFGRVERDVSAEAVERLVLDQFTSLGRLASRVAVILRFVKPHGALYNQAQREPHMAAGLISAVARLRVPVLGQPGGEVERLARERGVPFVAEGFPERRYTPEGRLVPRSEANAVLREPSEIAAQAVALVARGVQTLCIHGDDPSAVAKADTVLAALRARGVRVRGFLDAAAH